MTIKIVEYDKSYALGLAKMWNESANSWGGFDSLETEESVIQEHEGSSNLKTWLALDGDEVVGYCCFSEYREDEGASYIPLLNVRPDYQSKKVGKALILKALEHACDCQWPRLDLYTWPGNTKATPLYKKCGFFWEDRDDTTHLMNFMPCVQKTEAVAYFFEHADWYADSVREIKVEPDGRKENGFEYMGYHWEQGGKMLKMDFEGRGRGLRLIETDDWLVSATVENANLAFGSNYKITYKILNKTGKPLEVKIKGKDDKNITFNLDRTVNVEGETQVDGEFHVGEIHEEQNVWRTHPGVAAEIQINGKKASFKVGIVPKFPALINAVVKSNEAFVGGKDQFYLNIENCYRVPATFSFTLPEADFISLEKREFEIAMEPEQQMSVAIPYTLNRLGLLSGKLKISAMAQGGAKVEFDRELSAVFAGTGARFGGEAEDKWFAVNGRYMLMLMKFNNMLGAVPLEKEPCQTSFMRPQLGLPYSVEFAKTKPFRVEHGQERDVAYIRAFYQSQVYPGIEIERYASLQADGLVSQSWGISNKGNKAVDDLWFRTAVQHNMTGAIVPLKDIIESRDGQGGSIGNYQLQDLQENWILARGGSPRGLCWPEELKPTSAHGMLCFDQNLGQLDPGQSVATKPIYLALGTFKDWKQLRQFAQGKKGDDPAIDGLELKVNNGNPFVSQEYELAPKEHRNIVFQGTARAVSGIGSFAPQAATVKDNLAAIRVPAPKASTVDLVTVEVDTENTMTRRRAAVWGIGGEIHKIEGQREGLSTLTIANGVLKFSAAPDFGPAVFSLEYNGREWLDSSFPLARANSWWNPWLGGISLEISGFALRSLLKESRTAEFTTMEDNVGNQWQGVKFTISVTQHPKYKGLKISQNFLTLPGLAGICMVNELEHSGLTITDSQFLNDVFLAPGGGVKGSWLEADTDCGETLRIKQGAGLQTNRVNQLFFGSEDCAYKLLALSDTDITGYTNPEVMNCGSWELLSLLPGVKQVTSPLFFLFPHQELPLNALKTLKQIKF